MAKIVDTRGLPCPQPVLLTREALKESDTILTIVDSDTARHNVTRMAERAGYTVRAEEREEGIYLHITRGQAAPEAVAPTPTLSGGPLVLVVPSELMGRGKARSWGNSLSEGSFTPSTRSALCPMSRSFFQQWG
ncbi:MAG: sulfurtransferase TusA family protein [Anaerolineae bacterium]|nr:sulfurtransferase TusA family protein [Anaerolineae bacterium]